MENLSQVFAAIGALLVIIAIAGLAGLWWAILAAGFLFIASSYALYTQVRAAGAPAAKSAGAS